MKKLLCLVVPVVLLSACTEDGARVAAGAGVGAALDRDAPARGAILGATSGLIANELIAQNSPTECVYRDPATGQTFTAACPG